MTFKNLSRFYFFYIPILIFGSRGLAQATRFYIKNNCPNIIWAAAVPGGGKMLIGGETWTLDVESGTTRVWARTNCKFDEAGRGKCESGDCFALLKCRANGQPPYTLAEFARNQSENFDRFDISLLNGFNVPIEISPTSENCSEGSRCVGDVNWPCPQELRDPGGCNNPCTVFINDQFCCTSGRGSCEETNYSKFFKAICPDAITYPADYGLTKDNRWTSFKYCPRGTNYNVVFCPNVGLALTLTFNVQDTPQDYLNAHNSAREQVGVGNLTWDNTVAGFAETYANLRQIDCRLVHSGGPYGENIAWSSGDLSGTEGVGLWVDEKADYDYSSNTCASGEVCGHYTQVVWRNSVRVGCAKVRCKNGGTFICCNYDPPGNYVGQKPY